MDKEELEAEARDIADQISIWRSLKDSSGWQRFSEVVMEQMQVHSAQMRTPLESLDQVPKQEFMKGELFRAGLLLGLPDTQLEVLKAQAEHLQKELEDVEEDMVSASTSEREREQQRKRALIDELNDAFGDPGS